MHDGTTLLKVQRATQVSGQHGVHVLFAYQNRVRPRVGRHRLCCWARRHVHVRAVLWQLASTGPLRLTQSLRTVWVWAVCTARQKEVQHGLA